MNIPDIIEQTTAPTERAEAKAHSLRRMVSCEWLEDEMYGHWKTDCGELHEFTNGGPEDNRHNFCAYCGKPLKALHCQAANDRAKP